jgi:hypothetical protein
VKRIPVARHDVFGLLHLLLESWIERRESVGIVRTLDREDLFPLASAEAAHYLLRKHQPQQYCAGTKVQRSQCESARVTYVFDFIIFIGAEKMISSSSNKPIWHVLQGHWRLLLVTPTRF